MRAQEHGFESFEEADDFDVDDDEVPLSPYELTEMQEERTFLPAKPPFKDDEVAERPSAVSASEGKPPEGSNPPEVPKSG